MYECVTVQTRVEASGDESDSDSEEDQMKWIRERQGSVASSANTELGSPMRE